MIEVPGENGEQVIFEGVIVEKFEELRKDFNIQEAECIWRKLNWKKSIPTHFIVLNQRVPDTKRSPKNSQREQIGSMWRIDKLTATVEARRQ